MKKFSKRTAVVLSVIFSIVLVIGMVLSFIPMTFGAKTFVSFSDTVSISSDITGGMYGEFDITTKNASKKDIVSSMAKIKDVFEENGYKNTNIYAIGNSKIRLEISYPKGNKNFTDVYALISNVASGAFSLRSTQELSDTSIVLEGDKHVKDVKVFTHNDQKSMSIVFTEEGEEVYREICDATSTIYMVLGEYSQGINVTGVYDYSNLSLSDTDYSNLVELEQRIKLGCLDVDINSTSYKINTMSASFSAGESSSSSRDASFASTTAFVLAMSAIFVVIAIGLAVFAVKFGYFAIIVLSSLLFNIFAFLGIICLIPSVEFGLSTVASLIIGISVIYSFTFSFAQSVKTEYNQGKTLTASLENVLRKQMLNVIISSVMLFLSSLVMFMLAFGELSSVTIVFTVCAFLNIVTNLLLIPLFVKISISYKNAHRVFMLEKRNAFEQNAKEAE